MFEPAPDDRDGRDATGTLVGDRRVQPVGRTELLGESAELLAKFAAVVDGLLELDLVGHSSQQVLEFTRRFEVQKRRLAAVDHRVVAELTSRGVAAEVHLPNTAVLLRLLLRLSISQARRRVLAAENIGPRRGLTGEALAPLFEQVALAQQAGTISADHAGVITRAVESLPATVQAEHGEGVQADLVRYAQRLEPGQLDKAARRLAECLDPDGDEPADRAADHERRRSLTLSSRRDGSYRLEGVLTPECGALWRSILDSLGRPMPGAGGRQDPRRAPQRLHDGFFDAGKRLLRCEQVPDAAGAPVTLVLTARASAGADGGSGYATTQYGDLIPIRRAVDLCGDAQVISVLFDPHGGVLDYGLARRIASPAQRRALAARDRGCTSPGCDRAPPWCEVHHFRDYSDGGPTSIANMGLLCGFHHREHPRQGWQAEMINGRPHWIPPAWFDPTQTPRRNTMFDVPAF